MDRTGRIINLSTDAAHASAGQIACGSSKAAIEAITRAAAIELGPLGITVNAVAPGPIQTGCLDADAEAALAARIPVGRIGRPEDIAEAVVFLASERSCFITGQVIKVDGDDGL